MARYNRGEYTPVNPDKYIGTYPIVYRSSWELTACRMFDQHQNILQWASESVKIPYRNPLSGKYTVYVPDFLIVYEDKNGKQKAELIEIKPQKETFVEHAKSNKDKLSLAINAAKWAAAQAWAKNHGMVFRVVNENSIFNNPKRR